MVAGHGLDESLLWPRVQAWAGELGFSQIGVGGVDLSAAEPGLLAWLAAGAHGGRIGRRDHCAQPVSVRAHQLGDASCQRRQRIDHGAALLAGIL